MSLTCLALPYYAIVLDLFYEVFSFVVSFCEIKGVALLYLFEVHDLSFKVPSNIFSVPNIGLLRIARNLCPSCRLAHASLLLGTSLAFVLQVR